MKTTIKKKGMMEQNNNQTEQYASQERISKHLREIEEQHHIKILYAVESGSRAWGFSSPDSDWDVRFIYVHESEWYFHIEEQKDTIEQMFPDETDMSGWDLKKALRLFKSSTLHPEKKTSHDDKLNKLMYDTVNRMATEISNAASVQLFN